MTDEPEKLTDADPKEVAAAGSGALGQGTPAFERLGGANGFTNLTPR
jgi:hypothetical protein